MTTPLRIQRKRTRGWRLPPNTVCASRPGPFGNPYQGDGEFNQAYVARLYREYIRRPEQRELLAKVKRDLRGKNLACWCELCDRHKGGKPFGVECPDCAPCHADPLGEIANR